MDCGPTCLYMIFKYYGKSFSINELRKASYIDKDGVSFLGLSQAANSFGCSSVAVKISFKDLKSVQLPCIVHWNSEHFVVVYKITKSHVKIADPAGSLLSYSVKDFLHCWNLSDSYQKKGFALLIEPTEKFYSLKSSKEKNTINGFRLITINLWQNKNILILLAGGMLVISFIQLLFPFLTQIIVDVGINLKDVSFITTILIAQLTLFISLNLSEFYRRWVLLQLSTNINISIISDFLRKIIKLPMPFFDSKNLGDILQRIEDHLRVERFMSSSTLTVLFSSLSVIVYGFVLLAYSTWIFIIFFSFSLGYIIYVLTFMRIRKNIDYKRFSVNAQNRANLIQLINGMQEIKLYGGEDYKISEWEQIQGDLFLVNKKSVRLEQWQEGGGLFLNELKNIVITYIAAISVIEGQITLGMMLAIQYIIGQLNGPINEFVGFSVSFQDAKLSLDRIGEIHSMQEEEKMTSIKSIEPKSIVGSIHLNGLSFQYSGPESPKVLENIVTSFEEGKVTAIVGESGSGKTTLMKLLLRFYSPVSGAVVVGRNNLKQLSPKIWRSRCGVVMQDGYIFSDTIAKNICLDSNDINIGKLNHAIMVANLDNFIHTLPQGFETKIGADGVGLSGGQKQRILIARAVYKDPKYLFFDEATSSLDANNEKRIIENLTKFFIGKTVIIIAHRLSTVKNADKIIVLKEGRVIEEGNHIQLTKNKSFYYNLVKNQLELGT